MSDVVGDIDSVFHHFAVDVANLFHSMFYGHEPRRVVSFLFFYSHDDKLFVFVLLFFFCSFVLCFAFYIPTIVLFRLPNQRAEGGEIFMRCV